MISIKEVQKLSKENSEVAQETKKCLGTVERDIINAAQRGKYSVISILPNTVRGKSYAPQVLEKIILELKSQGYLVSVKNTAELVISWTNSDTESSKQDSPKKDNTKGIPDIKSFDDLFKDPLFIKSLGTLSLDSSSFKDLEKQFKGIFK